MKPTHLKQLTKSILYLPHYKLTDRPVLGAVSGTHKTLIVDAGNSPGHARVFLSGLSQYPVAPAAYVAITHWHWDHVFGIKEMGLPTFAHIETKKKVDEMLLLEWDDRSLDQRVMEGKEIEFCRDALKLELPDRTGLILESPDIVFHDRVEVDLGGIICIIEHVGGDHSDDSSVVYIPEENVVFTGDSIYMDLYDGEWSFSREKLFPLIEKIMGYNADYYVHSHEPVYTREEMIDYFDDLKLIWEIAEKYEKTSCDLTRRVVKEFEKKRGQPVDDAQMENIGGVLAGIRKS